MYALVAVFAALVLGIVLSVVLNLVRRDVVWRMAADAYTIKWYRFAVAEFGLAQVLWVTVEVGLVVTAVALALGLPAAYVLARRQFPGKGLVLLGLVLPVMVPPITYGIPLAAMIYRARLGGSLAGVIIVNMVPGAAVRGADHDAIFRADRSEPRARRADARGARHDGVARVLPPLALPGRARGGV